MSRPMRILSLGAGVQSSALLLMSCRGDLPKLDAAIFADTQWEPPSVYAHLIWLEEHARAAGIPVYRVTEGNLREHALYGRKKKTKDGLHFINLPIFTRSASGKLGKVKARQCTMEYKIRPILRKVMEMAGVPRGGRGPKDPIVEQWLGISADEMRRLRRPLRRWIVNGYPLICDRLMYFNGRFEDGTERMWNRQLVKDWLDQHYPGHAVPRSACIGCPYHNNEEWRVIMADPVARADAIEADERIRVTDNNMNMRRNRGYLHKSGVPLVEADLSERDNPLPWLGECQGMCGV